MSENGSNDADKRPRVYGRASGETGEIEFTVQGSEGETSTDVVDKVANIADELENRQQRLKDDENPERGVQ